MNKKTVVGLSILIATVLFFSFFGKNKEKNQPIQKAKIGVYKGDSSGLLIAAQEKGFFKQNNLDIEFVFYKSGRDAMKGMLKGEVDYSNCTDFVAIKNSFSNSHFKVLGSIATANINGMIAKKSSGILTPKDIKGKKIGTTIGTATEYYTGVFLEQFGYTLQDIQLINVPIKKRDEVIDKNVVDGLFAWEPSIYNIQKKYKNNTTFFPMPLGFEFYFVFVVNDSFHLKNKQISKNIIKALYEAENYANKNQNEFQNMIQNYFGYEKEYAKYSFAKQKFSLTFPYGLSTTMNNQARWLLKNKLVEGEIIDFNTIYDTSILKEINNIAVTAME